MIRQILEDVGKAQKNLLIKQWGASRRRSWMLEISMFEYVKIKISYFENGNDFMNNLHIIGLPISGN